MSATPAPPPPALLIRNAVEAALLEDLGRAGDITSAATIPAKTRAKAVIATREPGVVAGLPIAECAFSMIDPEIEFVAKARDGVSVGADAIVARIAGPARALLSAERVALNYLGHLSGIATATNRFVQQIAHTSAKITCTRKTTPGLRALEKYAVRCGGGSNHRFGLDDAILIKDNHIAVCGGVTAAISKARAVVGHTVTIEIEVDTLDQLREALSQAPNIVMLDNMAPDQLAEAVAIAGDSVILEASGGITLETVAAVAESGVAYISSGWITHSAPSLDLGLDIDLMQ